MKKLIYSVVLMAFMVIKAEIPVYAQDCSYNGHKCVGECGPWYFASDNQNPQHIDTIIAGTPKCHKVILSHEHGKPEFGCHCFLIRTSTRCRDGMCDESGCPNVYESPLDAKFGVNPIRGICISQGTGNNPNCACKYEK